LKSVKQEYEQRKAAQILVAEVEEKLVIAEVDVDKAEELVVVMNSDVPTKESLQQVQQALQLADEHVNQAMRVFDSKKQSATGIPLEELKKLEPRGVAAKSRIQQLRTSLKEAGERVTIDGYVTEAEEKLQAVTDAVAKLEEIDARFQDGVEYSSEEILALVKSSEGSAASAQTASSMARMFIQMKILEVRRFSSGPATEAVGKFQDFQKLLESTLKRLGELKGNINRRKRMSLVREAETQVVRAEGLVEKVKEAAGIFADDTRLMDLSPEDIREASEKTIAAEKEANDVLAEVRKLVTARQIETKGKDSSVEISAELIKFQTRLSSAQAEIGKQRKLFTSVEQRLAIKRQMGEAEQKLKQTEEKVAKATQGVATILESSAIPERVKEVEVSMQEAQISIKTMKNLLDSKARLQGIAKDAFEKLQPRVKAAQDSIDQASASMKERQEKMLVRSALDEAQTKVAECEASLQKAVDAEAPFLSDGPSGIADGTSLAELEKLIQSTQQVASGCKTVLAMKKLSVKRLSEDSSKSATEELMRMQATVEDIVKKLPEMRKRCLEWKKVMAIKGKAIPSKAPGLA